jgi:hypothetical protein
MASGGLRWSSCINALAPSTMIFRDVGLRSAEGETNLSTAETQRKLLENFIVANTELAQLELLAKRFNIFEALGVVRAERKHSNFLAFLLQPKASHRLGSRLLKRFLQEALNAEPQVSSLKPIDIELLDLSQAEVHVERDDIDILILDKINNLCVIIENKVDSSEHSDQLSKYFNLISYRFPSSIKFGVYLTADGSAPEEPRDREHYAPISHSKVRELVKEVSVVMDLGVEDGVKFALKQYVDVLGRHFMADAEIKGLCERIYKQHKEAIDLIFANLPDKTSVAGEIFKGLIASRPDLILDDCTTAYVRFIPKSIDLPYFRFSSDWTKSGRGLLFVIQFSRKKINLVLLMGSGDTDRRQQIHELAKSLPTVFRVEARLYEKQTLFKKSIVDDLDDLKDDEMKNEIRVKWDDFLTNDLPRIEKAFLDDERFQILSAVAPDSTSMG